MNKKTALTIACPLLITFSLTAHAGPAATEYELTLVEGPLPGVAEIPELPWAQLIDINDHGLATWSALTVDPDYFTNFIVIEAAGIYDTKKDEYVTLWQAEFDDLTGDPISVTGTYPFGLNNRGELVTGEDCSYINNKGEEILLTHPLFEYCETRGISSNGMISGYTIDDEFTWRGFVYNPKDDTFEDFLPDPFRNIAQGINSEGQVVGGIGAAVDRDGYVRNSDGSTRFFKVNIDGVRYPAQARGISADGTIVGVYATDATGNNGFVGRLSEDTNDEDLVPDAVFTPDNTAECGGGVFLTRINNKGVITGICFSDGTGAQKGLLLSPVPGGK